MLGFATMVAPSSLMRLRSRISINAKFHNRVRTRTRVPAQSTTSTSRRGIAQRRSIMTRAMSWAMATRAHRSTGTKRDQMDADGTARMASRSLLLVKRLQDVKSTHLATGPCTAAHLTTAMFRLDRTLRLALGSVSSHITQHRNNHISPRLACMYMCILSPTNGLTDCGVVSVFVNE